MSTTFTFQRTEDWEEETGPFAFVRWAGPGAFESPRRSTFDFGVDPSRVFTVEEFSRNGFFRGDDGSFVTWEQVAEGVWTFGDFGGTFEAGSGDAATWAGF